MARNRISRLRFNVWGLLKFQLLIAPVFLAKPYMDYQAKAYQFNPYKVLIWFLAPPFLYVVAFVTVRLRRTAPKSFVFTGARSGILYGLLFGVLAWLPGGGPAVVQAMGECCKMFSQVLRRGFPFSFEMVSAVFQETLAEAVLISGFLGLHYAVVGAVAGVIAGLVIQAAAFWKQQYREVLPPQPLHCPTNPTFDVDE